MLITNARIAGRNTLVDVRCAHGKIVAVGTTLAAVPDEHIIDAAGAVLLPGLHDHHIHLYALAALQRSVRCGPPQVCDRAQLAQALRAAPGDGWVRGVGYHESVAGDLDREVLDDFLPERPLKIQHRSGKLWIVNSLAAHLLSLDASADMPGVERGNGGRPNGRLFRLDQWLRERQAIAGAAPLPSLYRVSRQLASYGVTGVTDATPDNNRFTMQAFAYAAASGELLQNVRVMGVQDLPESGCTQVYRGERKVILDDDALPDWDTLRATILQSHEQGRAVAVHCVTPAQLVLTLSVLRDAGPWPGDRIEHASLVPGDVLPLLREVGVRVVTQPGFIYERGDQYAQTVEAVAHGDLYRCRAHLAQGIPLAGSTDAPYGDPDPWAAMRAAVHRKSRCGIPIGVRERLTPEEALALFTSAADDPGGASRTIAVGSAADLCLLRCRWEDARLRLRSDDVRATLRCGVVIYSREAPQAESSLCAASLA